MVTLGASCVASATPTKRTHPRDPVFALVDCENFYVSCERVFDPALRDVPVAVLSNNDGCIIARSEELKQAGVPMGAPLFKWKEELGELGTKVLSSNYTLYGDMSRRVHSILEEDALELERYSIDEAFLTLPALKEERPPAARGPHAANGAPAG
jgi:DNA polymerase V